MRRVQLGGSTQLDRALLPPLDCMLSFDRSWRKLWNHVVGHVLTMAGIIRVYVKRGRKGVTWLPILVALCTAMSPAQMSSGQELCGRQAGGAVCPDGSCCSSFGFCGTTFEYCGTGCQSLCSRLGGSSLCNATNACSDSTLCCSPYGYCGSDSIYCGIGCQNGPCTAAAPKNKQTNVYIGIAVGVLGVAILIVLVLSWLILQRTKRRRQRKLKGLDREQGLPDSSVSKVASGIRFSYGVLSDCTDGFTKELGRGAFGVVYKGKLKDDTEIAVKMLLDNERGLKDFEAEVKTLGSINHANLVALFGFCFERKKPFLVYEYVCRGSLDKWIFHKEVTGKPFVLPWKVRVDIVKGTAKGLAYLHEDLQIGRAIIHLDIKPENILLDEHFVPKVADFGMAKLLGAKKTQSLLAGGTVGYMAPEVHVGSVSPKLDVYSFGIVLLEVLSGRRLLDYLQPVDRIYLPAFAVRKLTEGLELKVIEPLLPKGEIDHEEARRLIIVALLCLQRDPENRPGMSTVWRMIEGIGEPPDLAFNLKSELEMTERLVNYIGQESRSKSTNSSVDSRNTSTEDISLLR